MPTFHFELVSPDKVLFNGPAQSVLVPGNEGDFLVLSDHAPVMTAMRPGVVGIDDAEGKQAAQEKLDRLRELQDSIKL